MGNIISVLQEIFMLKEDNRSKIGLSDLKTNRIPEVQVQKKSPVAKELKISDLMRRSY